MSNYQELLAQQQALAQQMALIERQLADSRRAEKVRVIAQVKELMAQHGLTVDDLAGKGGKAPSAAAGVKVAPKYKHPSTGETWTGRGLQPKWLKSALAEGKTLEQFAIA